jgi:hypothetical protein
MDDFKWNHDEVSSLAKKWNEAGLSNTSSGRFLNDLAAKGKPPMGRGISWLMDLLEKGDPRPWVELGKAVADLAPKAGTDAETVMNIARHLSNGDPLKDWHREVIERVKGKILQGGQRVPTPQDKELARSLENYKAGQSPFYWAHRSGSSNKIDRIIRVINSGGEICDDDINYLRSNFKGVVRELDSADHPVGCLRWIEGAAMYSGAGHRITGVVACIVMSKPFVDNAHRVVSVNVMVNDTLGVVRMKSLFTSADACKNTN